MSSEQSCNHPITETLEGHELCVARVPIFNHLHPDQLTDIAATIRSIPLRKGELLYRAGDVSDSLFMVHRGALRVYRLAENGKEQLVRVLREGSFTGEFALFNQSMHDCFAEATETTEVCRIGRRDLEQLMLRYSDISLKILQELSSRLEQAEARAARFTAEDTETRLQLYLARQAEEQATWDVKLPMTRRDLASLLGTTPETISRKLAAFEANGWIEQRGRWEIGILKPAAFSPGGS